MTTSDHPTVKAPRIASGELAERLVGGPLRIGTRTTTLALAQTERVAAALRAVEPALSIELVKITTSADLWEGELSQLGGKGAFTKEIDRALITSAIDIAVHSMKDVPGDVPLPAGTGFGAYLSRGNVHDVVVTRDGGPLAELPAGSKVGTSAARRRAQLSLFRPDLRSERVRGGVDTRLRKLDSGEYDALILGHSGLERAGLADRITEQLPVMWVDKRTLAMVPPVGAAVIGVQARTIDIPIMRLLEEINHPRIGT